jgi:hypothetical protein
MDLFLFIINILVAGAVVITAVRMYLTVNKMWKRKQEKSVAESISIFAYFLAIMVHLPFMLKYAIIDKSALPAMNDALNISGYSVIIIIGAGLWVKENRGVNFFKLLYRALHLERKESGDLIKSLIQPSGAKQIMNILQKVAYIDNELVESEIKLVNDFARHWKIEMPDLKDWAIIGATNLMDIRESVVEYLDISPPPDQAAHLVDVIKLIIKADNIVTKDEQLFLEEATGMINDYINKNSELPMYHVLIVPQNEVQIDAIKNLFPNAELEERRGGKVFVRGKFYSKNYADAICEKYISLGMFSIWEES